MYLLDTNVISELRKPKPHGGVLAWMETLEVGHVHLSAATVGEVQRGIERTRKQDLEKAQGLEAWLLETCERYAVLALDGPAFRVWAKLIEGRSITLASDAMIAATALTHRLTVATRNVADFRALGLEPFNPFEFRGQL